MSGRLASNSSSRIGSLIGTPVNLSNDATEARTNDLSRRRLDPILQQQRSSTETDLLNRGITPGTEAYDRAMKAVGQQENDAYTQMILQGHGQSVSDILAERNQPINEISALQSGSQVSQPNFVNNTPTASVAPVDYTGAVNNNFNGQLAAYGAKVSQNNAMIGGLAGLGGAALGGWGSYNGFNGFLPKKA